MSVTTDKQPAVDHKASWTDEQRRAVETREVSVSLSAGAGCGKTFVLSERYLDHFVPNGDAPPELGRVVAITFTERAAREMRDRIRRKCHERLLAADDQEAPYWAAMCRALDTARVSTIHSFCGALLRARAVEAGLDPQFQVLEQAQAETLLAEVIDDHLRQTIAAKDRVTVDLAVRFDLNALKEMLATLAREYQTDVFREWRAKGPAELVKAWEQYFRESLIGALADTVGKSSAAQTILSVLAVHESSNPVMLARAETLRKGLLKLTDGQVALEEIPALLDSLHENARVQGDSAKNWSSAVGYAAFKEAAEQLRKLVDSARELALFDRKLALPAAEAGCQLLALADTIGQEYQRRKESLALLDFSDLVSRAGQLLSDPRHSALRRQMGAQIDLLLVDEFQDTDPVQAALVKALCDEQLTRGKLFFVGDYKQSIYRFRGADPEVFRQLREIIPSAGQQFLTLNFRSQPAILTFVNALFCDELGPQYEALRPSRPQVSPTPAIEFLWAPSPEGTKENAAQMRRREADWIARRVRALIDSRQPLVWDAEAARAGKPAARPAEPGDVVLLFRALSNVEYYEEALRKHGLDYYLVGGHAFYAQQEIYDLLNLLRAIHSPGDPVSLVGALRSGFFSLADETIFWLAQQPGGLALALGTPNCPRGIAPEQWQRVSFAADVLARLRGQKDRLRICELIELALAETAYDALLVNEFLGERKLANLRKLIEQARSFEQSGMFGLADFIAELANFVARQPDEPLAATHSENTNVLRLMTIHQAKGLEFPIVVVPDLDRPPHNSPPRAYLDAQLGPLVKVAESADSPSGVSGFEMWNFSESERGQAELNRLLYVAATRAADYLILSSSVKQLGKATGPWMKFLASRFDLVTGKFVAELPAGQSSPQVQVTCEEPPAERGRLSRRAKVDWQAVFDELESAEGGANRIEGVDPVPVDTSARRRFSFSRLAGDLYRPAELPEGTEPAAPAGGDALLLGTLVHRVLADLDGARNVDCRALVERHAERALLTGTPEAAEALKLVERFVRSPRAGVLARARQSHAEIDFVLAWPPEGHAPVGEQGLNMLEGVIDRLYQDADGHWHLLDFKTNQVSEKNVAEKAAAYEMQMLVYALATEKILGVAPRSVLLHFLRTGAEHEFRWNEDARARAVRLVDEGITKAV